MKRLQLNMACLVMGVVLVSANLAQATLIIDDDMSTFDGATWAGVTRPDHGGTPLGLPTLESVTDGSRQVQRMSIDWATTHADSPVNSLVGLQHTVSLQNVNHLVVTVDFKIESTVNTGAFLVGPMIFGDVAATVAPVGDGLQYIRAGNVFTGSTILHAPNTAGTGVTFGFAPGATWLRAVVTIDEEHMRYQIFNLDNNTLVSDLADTGFTIGNLGSAADVVIFIERGVETPHNVILLDHVTIEVVPEPGTAVLAGCGALILLRRRR